MDIPLDEVIYFDCITTHPSTGAATDADSTPTFAVYEEATDTDIGVGGNLTKRTSLTGNYRGTFTASAANGFEVGKWYSIIGSATVNSIAGKAVLRGFRIVLAEAVAGEPKVDVGAWGGSATPVTNINTIYNTDYATLYDTTNKAFLSKLGNFAMGGSSLALTTGAISGTTLTLSGAVTASNASNAINLGTDSIGSTQVAASAVTEIQSGLATSANQTTILSRIGTPSDLGGGASLSFNLSDIEAQTDDIGVAGAGLSAIPDLAGVTTLLSRLTSTRAGYLDNLSAGAVATAASIAALNNLSQAQAQTAAESALQTYNLDHLIKSAVDTDFPTTVHLNSVIGHIVDNGTSATFDRTTDSLEVLQAEHDATQSAIAALNNITAASVWSVGTRTLTALGFTLGASDYGTDWLTATGLAASAVTEIQSGLSTLTAAGVRTAIGLASANLDTQLDALPTAAENTTAIFAQAVESGVSFLQAQRAIASAAAGKREASGTDNEKFYAIGNAATLRITTSADAAGDGTPSLSL